MDQSGANDTAFSASAVAASACCAYYDPATEPAPHTSRIWQVRLLDLSRKSLSFVSAMFIGTLLKDNMMIFFMDSDCEEHARHLIVLACGRVPPTVL